MQAHFTPEHLDQRRRSHQSKADAFTWLDRRHGRIGAQESLTLGLGETPLEPDEAREDATGRVPQTCVATRNGILQRCPRRDRDESARQLDQREDGVQARFVSRERPGLRGREVRARGPQIRPFDGLEVVQPDHKGNRRFGHHAWVEEPRQFLDVSWGDHLSARESWLGHDRLVSGSALPRERRTRYGHDRRHVTRQRLFEVLSQHGVDVTHNVDGGVDNRLPDAELLRGQLAQGHHGGSRSRGGRDRDPRWPNRFLFVTITGWRAPACHTRPGFGRWRR